MTAPPSAPPRTIWNNRKFVVVYSVLLVGVVVLAGVALYYDLAPPPNQGTSGPTYALDNITLSFTGIAASNVTPAATWCPPCWYGTYSEGRPLPLTVGITLVGAAASCSHLGQTGIYGIAVPETGKFELDRVTWNETSLAGSGSLPVFLPYGNATACDTGVSLQVTLSYIPPGPSNETLSLTIDADWSPGPPP
jgi:hypothetical protein